MILILIEFLVLITLYHIPAANTASLLANETDYRALLAFKARITSDPFNALSSWNDSVHFCSWKGVTCGSRHPRVTILELASLGLAGSLSPQIGNLTFLQRLNLSGNAFDGAIPEEISKLSRLQIIALANNSLVGKLPRNLTICKNLLYIILHGNNLEGQLPDTLSSLGKLIVLSLSTNGFTGSIPRSLGNLSSLNHLYLARNYFEGSVPSELGQLSNLAYISLATNNLSGPMPTSLYNSSSIISFSIVVNNVSGSLPSDLFLTLPKLQGFYLGVNSFSGPLPASITNASELRMIDISQNSFTGPIPVDLGGLKNLEVLNFGGNPLGTEEGDDLRFLASLTNCTNLRILWSQLNSFKGALPDSVGNFSDTFTSLMLDRNFISGAIPSGIGNLVNLEVLSLYSNKLVGSVPDSIGKLSKLKMFFMYQNNLSGTIQHTLGNMTSLIQLNLRENMLEGALPSSIGNCTQLDNVDLSQNRFIGPIPEELFGLSSLSAGLRLAKNHFTGRLPSQVGNLINLRELDVSENSMSAELPSTLGTCQVLELLVLRGNKFNGTIPSSLKNLRGLQVLDLSRNNLSGPIPGFLGDLPLIENLNLSFNMFEGEVPNGRIFDNISAVSLAGNSKLCGGPPVLQLSKCKIPRSRRRTWTTVVAVCVTTAILLTLLNIIAFVLYRSKESKAEAESTTGFLHWDPHPKLSYMEISEATDGFSPSNIIGEGSFGVVYKGVLASSEQVVAVKVLKPDIRGADQSFLAECEALRNIRHRNLVKTITSCSSTDSQGNHFKALMLDYMPNGSLEKWLHPIPNDTGENDNGTTLSIMQRLNIAIDMASALHYLHHQCQTPIVHCDLKPNNVLLDLDFSAHLSDFGLAKFLTAEKSGITTSSIGLRGTIGYVAPEYGFGGEASALGDVYSFGILLLEMFTGKRPTGPMFGGNFGLREFVEQSLLPDGQMQVIDPMLCLGEVEGSLRECLVSVLRVGLKCSNSSPKERVDIGEALQELSKARDVLDNTTRYSCVVTH
ncbi:putative receptor-like protein kinase At3g47110 [Punica granatum]|uniref:non-specific serine/threonine protein kinase n=2 Tax=Punica granatum TaxID=22663 RepID=A0A218XBL6_PUNGR|nr:putative receptor-like protein kinase At3g47110 [Punica granatum]OWM82324.1 hypothetical protein CDL15_Pgr001898 [Punica granatum]PKI62105.1 hypothetical protein CRG98_017478 [Punica granatum]